MRALLGFAVFISLVALAQPASPPKTIGTDIVLHAEKPPPQSRVGMQPLYFLHVPKAGGTTMLQMLPKLFGSHGLPACDQRMLESPPGNKAQTSIHASLYVNNKTDGKYCQPKSMLKSLAEMFGIVPRDAPRFCLHLPLNGHHPYTPDIRAWRCDGMKPIRMVLLREPLSRIRSAYSHALMMKDKNGCCGMPAGSVPAIREKRLNLSGYCSMPGSANVMSKQLIGRHPSERRDTDPALAVARHALTSNFDFIGITELYSESVALLKYTLGLPGSDVINVSTVGMHLNTHTHTQDPGCDDESARKHNALDIALYQTARTLFVERFCAVWPQHAAICAPRVLGTTM